MTTLSIRDFRESDAEPLAKLFFESVRHGTQARYAKRQREAWAPSIPDTQEYALRLSKMSVLVAEDNHGIAGFMAIDDEGYIDLAYVRPDRIRTGVASKLYSHVESLSLEKGLCRLSADASELAKPFFEKHGWTIIRKQTVERKGVSLTNYRMQKQLAPV